MKRQWRDGDGVVHELLGDQKLKYKKRSRLKCGGWTPTLWHATKDAPTCLRCITHVPKGIYIGFKYE
jgi:hypothetical protein